MSIIPPETAAKIQDLLSVAPVDVAEIAARLGMAVYSQPLASGVSGVLIKDEAYRTPSGFAIMVNPNEAYVRQRFTAAHEIGHFVLHRNRIGDRIEDNYLLRSEGLSNSVEAQANKFAADLLMPWPLLNSSIEEGVKTLSGLAAKFEVSEVAMAIRLGHPT